MIRPAAPGDVRRLVEIQLGALVTREAALPALAGAPRVAMIKRLQD